MERRRRLSKQAVDVLQSLVARPTKWRYGYDLCQETGLKAGSMYPILMRLADRGLLETAWEDDAPAGRPPRHLYRLTSGGRAYTVEMATAAKRAARTRGTGLRAKTEGA